MLPDPPLTMRTSSNIDGQLPEPGIWRGVNPGFAHAFSGHVTIVVTRSRWRPPFWSDGPESATRLTGVLRRYGEAEGCGRGRGGVRALDGRAACVSEWRQRIRAGRRANHLRAEPPGHAERVG